MGGINTIPDPSSVAVLTDPIYPTVVMGMYLVYISLILHHQGLIAYSPQVLMLFILHLVPMVVPPSLLWSATLTQTPRSMLRVRFFSTLPNLNNQIGLDSRVQTSKQEMIEDLEVMSKVYFVCQGMEAGDLTYNCPLAAYIKYVYAVS